MACDPEAERPGNPFSIFVFRIFWERRFLLNPVEGLRCTKLTGLRTSEVRTNYDPGVFLSSFLCKPARNCAASRPGAPTPCPASFCRPLHLSQSRKNNNNLGFGLPKIIGKNGSTIGFWDHFPYFWFIFLLWGRPKPRFCQFLVKTSCTHAPLPCLQSKEVQQRITQNHHSSSSVVIVHASQSMYWWQFKVTKSRPDLGSGHSFPGHLLSVISTW